MADSSKYAGLEKISVKVVDKVAEVTLTGRMPALSLKLIDELTRVIPKLSADPDVRCVVLSSEGKCFLAGLDFKDPGIMTRISPEGKQLDIGRRAAQYSDFSRRLLAATFERCARPVIAAVHGPCLGAGVNMVVTCDIRICSADTLFSVREVRAGFAADGGTLQLMPTSVGCDSWVREIALTGRDFGAEEACAQGFVQEVCATREATVARAHEIARQIAAHSPVAVYGTKASLNFSRDHTVADGLDHIANLNSALLQAPDVRIAAGALLQRKVPEFPDLLSVRSAL
eukprot:NODE_16973_length_968_cov_1.736029.p1 GENE.NODE_16973_length_968_cov_1.736029~~NODE_16973_length_968_cov_1.736029.p1  ORF type:complete len:316 (-),score=75.00 NODE_16973_length_968_cov_1.736029:20-877(-)